MNLYRIVMVAAGVLLTWSLASFATPTWGSQDACDPCGAGSLPTCSLNSATMTACGCTTTTGTVSTCKCSAVTTVYVTISDVVTTKNVLNSGRTGACATCGNHKSVGVRPIVGKTWGTVAVCTDLETYCC
jgi:hypothetical protein